MYLITVSVFAQPPRIMFSGKLAHWFSRPCAAPTRMDDRSVFAKRTFALGRAETKRVRQLKPQAKQSRYGDLSLHLRLFGPNPAAIFHPVYF